MKKLTEKLAEAELEIAKEKGDFFLFALFLREDAPNLWDLLVSASWIELDKGGALRHIAKVIQSKLSKEELTLLSRISIIDRSNPALEALASGFHLEHGLAEVRDSNFFGLAIKHAYIITSRRVTDDAKET